MAIWTPTLKTKAKKLKSEGCEQRYEVEVPAARFQETLQDVFVRLQLQARISGFRPGKAPIDIIKRQFAQTAETEAIEQIIRVVVPETLKDIGVRAVTVPTVGNISLRPGSPLTFELLVEAAPEFKPTGYTGISVTRTEYPVEELEIEDRVRHLQEGNARLDRAESETVAKDHYVVLDFELTRDGKVIESGRGKQELVDMSSDQTIDGLVQGLLGAKRQERREFEVVVDGKPTRCSAVVSEIKIKILPELDDEFAKDMGTESMGKLRDELRSILLRENAEKSEREVALQIEKALLEANRFEIPKSLAEHQLEHMLERLEARIMGPDRRLPDKEAGELREKLKPQAADQVRLQFILGEIARKENLSATEEDFEKERAASIEKAEGDEQKRKTKELFEKSKDDILAAIRERKVIRLIRDSAKIKSAKPSAKV